MTIHRAIDAAYLSRQLGYVERAAELAPKGTYQVAHETVELFTEIAESVFALVRTRGLKLNNSDGYREVEAVIYGWLRAANPEHFDTTEGFGEHADGPAGDRVIAQAISDRDALAALREFGEWKVVNTDGLKPGEQCPVVFTGLSEDECSAWIGEHGDARLRLQGLYHIDGPEGTEE